MLGDMPDSRSPDSSTNVVPITGERGHSPTDTSITGSEMVHVPTTDSAIAPDDDPRVGDVDEWGRSENIRRLARRAFDPIYRHYFRAEWEGLEHIPTDGGALLVANHAGAVPSDAPVIMHGIETELERPVYGLADNFFRKIPVVGTMWSRAGGLPAHPDNVSITAQPASVGAGLSRRHQRNLEDDRQPLQAGPVWQRWICGDRHAGRRADHSHRGDG